MSNDETTGILSERLDTLHGDVKEIKSAVKELTNAIIKLALVEERQAQAALAIERAWGAIERLEKRLLGVEQSVPDKRATEERLAKLEEVLPDGRRANIWVDRAVTAIVAAMAMFVAKKIGLL